MLKTNVDFFRNYNDEYSYSKIVWDGGARGGGENLGGGEERQFFCKLQQKLTCSSFRCIFVKVFFPLVFIICFFLEKLYNEALANITRNRADKQPVDVLGKIFFRRICLKFSEYF